MHNPSITVEDIVLILTLFSVLLACGFVLTISTVMKDYHGIICPKSNIDETKKSMEFLVEKHLGINNNKKYG